MKADRSHKFSTNAKAANVAKSVSNFNHRGNGLAAVVQTVLNDFRNETGIKSLTKIKEQHIEQWVDSLKDRRDDDELAPATTANMVSALNRALEYIGKEKLKVDSKEEGLTRGPMDLSDKSNTPEASKDTKEAIQNKAKAGDIKHEALHHSVDLQTELDLRARESFAIKLNDKDPLASSLKIGKSDLTKNSRDREIPITKDSQHLALQAAKDFAQSHGWKSLIPPEYTLAQWKNWAYSAIQQINQETGHHFKFHGERHQYAHDQYTEKWKEKTGKEIQCPAVTGLARYKEWNVYAQQITGMSKDEIKALDKEIRMEISEALGHSREDVTRYYLG